MTSATRAAVLTPGGAAAVATIAIAGPDAWAICRAAFRPTGTTSLPDSPDAGRHWSGAFGQPPGDTVVLSIRRTGPSPWIEIHCHGGPQVVRWLLEELRSHGVQLVSWTDLLQELESAPLRAAAALELTRATTTRTAAILLDQYHGALDAALVAIAESLAESQVQLANARLAGLLRYADLGRHLTRPWRVAVAGAPNVGKSSLVNRLVGTTRSIVTPIPGTTRDVVTTQIAVDGWPVELIDTAGQRDAAHPLEREGIALARDAISTADLTLWLFEATASEANLPPFPNVLAVRNKIDLIDDRRMIGPEISISALTGQGIDELLEAVANRLVPESPPSGSAVPFTAEIVAHLTRVENLLTAGAVLEASSELRSLMTGGPPAKPS